MNSVWIVQVLDEDSVIGDTNDGVFATEAEALDFKNKCLVRYPSANILVDEFVIGEHIDLEA